MGHHAAHVRLHEPHAAARSAGDVAAAAVRARCCRGTWRSSTRSTGASSTRSRSRYPGRRGARRAAVAHRGGRREARAHGAPRLRRQPRRQRRRGAAHRAAQASVLRDFHELWPEKFSNKTNGVTPRRFLRADQSGLSALITERDRRRLDRRDLDRAAQARAARRRRRLPRALARGQARQQGSALRDYIAARDRHRGRPRLAVRRPGQAHPRVQAPASERAARRHALSTGSRTNPALDMRAAHVHLRRQGRARLPHGQAHHQAHQLRRRRGEPRPRRRTRA